MDVDSPEGKADSIDKGKGFQDNNAISSRGESVMWPMVKVGDYKLYYSAMMAANLQYLAANNNGIPSVPHQQGREDRRLMPGGRFEVLPDMDEANDYCNACGVVTTITIYERLEELGQ